MNIAPDNQALDQGTQTDLVVPLILRGQVIESDLVSHAMRGGSGQFLAPELGKFADRLPCRAEALQDLYTLSIDDIGVARLATDHLISLGHRAIAHIGGNRASEMDFHVPSKRRVGYEQALTAAGIPIDTALFQAADFTLQGGYAAAKQLLGDPRSRPTAVFVASDEMAIGTILAARDLGLTVPDDISVIGVDDHELSEFFGLSTIAQFPALQGRMAVDIVMDQLHPGHRDLALTNTPLPYELIVRSSTARPTSRKPN